MAISKETKRWTIAFIILVILVITIDLIFNHRH
jgi:hypothetical protein